jgi:transcriptional regulator with PAS, ATPase and Fis domain
MVKATTFRKDLFYRLHVLAITIPPLRERPEDIPVLSEYFLEHCALPEARKPLPTEVLRKLLQHDWPGNIRELQSVLWRYATTGHLSFASLRKAESGTSCVLPEVDGHSLSEAMEDFEKQWITQVLEHYNGHRMKTAAALGITERSLYRKIHKYQIN